ncbi:MAG: Protein of unknown function (DUF2484) [Rhodobacteraceae bacterium HLUCCO07]|uniref:DUF2484 family protein n=1 Tax=Aquicoccus sp. TaxID=2055851 RepID=UPI0006DA30DB|nr:MAG: Protein of unknown function (DUF2484) [Rhodobacteraceae bacterium HLUCCO07]
MTVNLSLIALFVWLVVANMAAMLPSTDNHWRRAYGLMATGLPLLVWIFWENPVWVGMLALVAGLSVLRWPLIYLIRWLRRKAGP